jgi:hypothetical protein
LAKLLYTMEYTTAQVFKCEDTKGVIRSLNSKKDRPDYAKVKKDKKTNNDLHHKAKNCETRTHKFRCSGRISSFCSTDVTGHDNFVINLVISHERKNRGRVVTLYYHDKKEHISSLLSHRYYFTLIQVILATLIFNFTNRFGLVYCV